MPRAVKVSEAAALALHSMGLMAALPQGLVSTRIIASVFGVSEAHLSKVLQRLAKVGLLHSARGPKGGFSLSRPAEEVTLLEIYEAIEGPYEPVDCLFQTPLCGGDGCILGSAVEDANKLLRDRLATTTLDDIRHVFRHKLSDSQLLEVKST